MKERVNIDKGGLYYKTFFCNWKSVFSQGPFAILRIIAAVNSKAGKTLSNYCNLHLPFSEVQEVFSQFDKDGDGCVSTNTLGAVIRSVGLNPAESEISALKDEFDGECKSLCWSKLV